MAICLTDLPVYRSGPLIVADVRAQRRVAGLSLPVLGAMRLLLQTTVRHPVGLGDHMTLAWMAASLATAYSALGASLEHEDTVRKAEDGSGK